MGVVTYKGSVVVAAWRAVSVGRRASGARNARAVRANSSIAVYRRIDSSAASSQHTVTVVCAQLYGYASASSDVARTSSTLVCKRLDESWSSTERHTARLVQLLWTCATELLACSRISSPHRCLSDTYNHRRGQSDQISHLRRLGTQKTCSHKPCW